MKKCDEGVADHREYDGALAAVREWLLSMESELALVSDTTGDKDAAQAKLAKLQVKAQAPLLLQRGFKGFYQPPFTIQSIDFLDKNIFTWHCFALHQ